MTGGCASCREQQRQRRRRAAESAEQLFLAYPSVAPTRGLRFRFRRPSRHRRRAVTRSLNTISAAGAVVNDRHTFPAAVADRRRLSRFPYYRVYRACDADNVVRARRRFMGVLDAFFITVSASRPFGSILARLPNPRDTRTLRCRRRWNFQKTVSGRRLESSPPVPVTTGRTQEIAVFTAPL